jgi:type VI secretion system secreted protein VgrG
MAGQSAIVLEGGNITLTMPGQFLVKGSSHAFLGGGGNAAALTALPDTKIGKPPREIELSFDYDDLSPVKGAPYKVTFEDGTVLEGKLDDAGYKLLTGVPDGAYTVEYGEDEREWQAPPLPPDDAEFKKPEVQAQGRALIERMLKNEPSGIPAETPGAGVKA